jgi:dTDP-glucose 4,6-dehydratase
MAIDKIKKELNWTPAYSFEEGLRSTVKWYLSPEGRKWLSSLEDAAKEVRQDQGKRVN